MTPEDRDAVYDVLRRYIWCMDTGDVDGIAATFTADGTVKDITGTHWHGNDAARNFASHFINRPDRPAAQHWVQHMDLDDSTPGSARVTSYWFTVVRDNDDGRKFVTNLGRYIDTVVNVDGRWLIKDKQIDPWNDQTVLAAKGG